MPATWLLPFDPTREFECRRDFMAGKPWKKADPFDKSSVPPRTLRQLYENRYIGYPDGQPAPVLLNREPKAPPAPPPPAPPPVPETEAGGPQVGDNASEIVTPPNPADIAPPAVELPPVPETVERDPLDHDGDGQKGGVVDSTPLTDEEKAALAEQDDDGDQKADEPEPNLDDLRAKANGLGIKVHPRWGVKRLQDEIAKAVDGAA